MTLYVIESFFPALAARDRVKNNVFYKCKFFKKFYKLGFSSGRGTG
jgi:hypothetical protein